MSILLFLTLSAQSQALTLDCELKPSHQTLNVTKYLAEYGLQKGTRDFKNAIFENIEDVRFLVQAQKDLEQSNSRLESVARRLFYNKEVNRKDAKLQPLDSDLEDQLRIEKESLLKQVKALEKQKQKQIDNLKKLFATSDVRIAFGYTNNPNDIHEQSFYLDVPLDNNKYIIAEPAIWFGDCAVKKVVRNRAKISLNMQNGKVDAFIYDGTSDCTASYSVSLVEIMSRSFKAQCQLDQPYEVSLPYKTLIIPDESYYLGRDYPIIY